VAIPTRSLGKAAWQWQPLIDAHDPNPPITIESASLPFVETQPTQPVRPKARAQQPPPLSAPVHPVAVQLVTNQSDATLVWQRTVQYPALQAPVFVDAAPAVTTMGWDAQTAQVFPRLVVQQPPPVAEPVYVPFTVIKLNDWDTPPVVVRPQLKLVPAQPPSRAGPDLPFATLADVEFPDFHSHVGPWKSGSKYYAAFRLVADPSQLVILRSVGDPTDQSTWSSVSDFIDLPNTIGALWTYQTAAGIHVAVQEAVTGRLSYHLLSTTSDSWTHRNVEVDVPAAPNQSGVLLGVNGAGDLYFGYHDLNVAWDRLNYSTLNGGVGGGQDFGVVFDPLSGDSVVAGALVVDASDTAHFLYSVPDDGLIGHRSLDTADALGTAQTITNTAGGTVGNAVIYDSGAPLFIKVVYDDADGRMSQATGIAAVDPTWSIQTGIGDHPMLPGISDIAIDVSGSEQTVHQLYIRNSDQMLWSDFQPHAEGFGIDVFRDQGSTISRLSANSYIRATLKVAFFWQLNGVVEPTYAEYEAPTPPHAVFLEHWNLPSVQVRRRVWAQQPPAEASPVFTPAPAFAPGLIDVQQAQTRLPRRPQQPPSESRPVATIPSTFFEVWRSVIDRVFPKRIAQQPPSLTAPPFMPTIDQWFAPSVQVRPTVRRQQPPSLTAPVFTEHPPETFFEDWQQPIDRLFPKRVAQQPPAEAAPPRQPTVAETLAWFAPSVQVRPKARPQQPASEAKPEATLPSTFFEAWREPIDRLFPKKIPQQPPSESAPPRQPTVAETLAWFAPTVQVRAKIRAQQPEATPGIVFTPAAAPRWFETLVAQVFRRRHVQQPPAETAPPRQPTVAETLAWQAATQQVRPKARAQQPPPLSAPPRQPNAAESMAWFAATVQERRTPGPQQPPSESAPVFTARAAPTWFETPAALQVVRRPVVQQPPAESAPLRVRHKGSASLSGHGDMEARCRVEEEEGGEDGDGDGGTRFPIPPPPFRPRRRVGRPYPLTGRASTRTRARACPNIALASCGEARLEGRARAALAPPVELRARASAPTLASASPSFALGAGTRTTFALEFRARASWERYSEEEALGILGFDFRTAVKAIEDVRDPKLWERLELIATARAIPLFTDLYYGGVEYAQRAIPIASQTKAIGDDLDFDERASMEIVTLTNDWWKGLSTRLRPRLFEIIATSREEGRSVEWVIREIEKRGLFAGLRASQIGVTETTRLFGAGAQAWMRHVEIPQWAWRTAEDERVDQVCDSMAAGSPYPITQEFLPAHVSCRCWPVPIVPGPGA